MSLFNVIEEIVVSAPPPEPQQSQTARAGALPVPLFQLVVLWTRSSPEIPEQGTARLRMVLPDKTEVPGSQFEVDLTKFLRNRLIIGLGSLPIGADGTYMFVIDSKTGPSEWNMMFELPLRVTLQRQDPG